MSKILVCGGSGLIMSNSLAGFRAILEIIDTLPLVWSKRRSNGLRFG